MDCIDCHNRPTHEFRVPSKAVDWIIDTHPDLRELPYYKKRAVAAIEGEYESHAEGMARVRQTMVDFYAAEYPEVAANRPELVAKGAELASETYGKTVFPHMQTNWETHPNHIGHDDFPGCMRCHDDEMSTPTASTPSPWTARPATSFWSRRAKSIRSSRGLSRRTEPDAVAVPGARSAGQRRAKTARGVLISAPRRSDRLLEMRQDGLAGAEHRCLPDRLRDPRPDAARHP
jgi:hypothetical protein